MRIALIANSTWNIYNFRLHIVKKLLEKGYEVSIIAPVDPYISKLKDLAGVSFVPLKHLKRKSTNPIDDIRLFFELWGIVKNEKFDLIINFTIKPNIYAGFVAGMRSIPFITVVTGLGYTFLHKGIINTITKVLYRLAFKKSSKVIFENEDDLILFKKLAIVPSTKGISVKGCGIDTAWFKPGETEQEKGTPTVFSFIGRLLYDKGIYEFIEAARLVRAKRQDIEFWVIGPIDKENPSALKEEDLLSWIKQKTVVYHGNADDVRPYIERSNCIVTPSYREGLPKINLEALAMAKAVITSDSAGCRETVTDGQNGYLFEVKNVKDLASKILKFAALSRSEQQQMGARGREKAETIFNDKLISGEYLSIIHEVLNEKK